MPVQVLACVGLLTGCSSDASGDWISLFRAVRTSWEERDAPVGLPEAAAIPFATIGLRINSGREQIVILAVDANGERLWTSAARIAISTRNGRIVRTAGFGTDLSGYVSGDGGRVDWSHRHSTVWMADFSDLGIYSARVSCDVIPAGPDPITILGKRFDTVRVDESCRCEKLDWSFINTYWVSLNTGRVWKSVEHVHPKGLVLDVELLRPPLSPD